MTDGLLPSSMTWDRTAALLDSAHALPSERRAAFLADACADDPALQAELALLLEAADRAPAYLEAFAKTTLTPAISAAVRETTAWAPSLDRSASAPSRTGTRVRHYEVLAPVGAGGMGVVHRGRDTRLGRDVAMKFLPAEHFADPVARQRLVREAQAVSALDDPHVCAMHAIEETDDGGVCLVMGYCAGGTLRERLRAGPLPVHDVVRLALQLASGLESAHRRHIIHGDLKPANVGITDGDGVKILDFGVAVRVGEDDTRDHLGRVGFMGTVAYAAPELLRGATPDVRSDLWALGVVCYEMVTGRRPFSGPTEAALLFAILDEEPAPLVRDDGVEVPGALAALIRSLLAKDPAKRPTSASEIVHRMRGLMRDTSSPGALDVSSHALGASPGVLQRARQVGLATVGLLAVIAGVLFTRGPSSAPGRPTNGATVATMPSTLPSLAVLPFTVRGDGELAYLRDGMVDLMTPAFDATGLVRGVDPNTVIGAVGAEREAVLDSAAAQALAGRVGAARYVVGSVVQTGTRVTLRATLYRESGAEIARATAMVDDRAQMFDGVESLVRELAAAELRAPGDTVAALAAATTSSTRALRAYLDGERELRDARPAAAVAHFTTAVTADSTFALAWYRLARAARWSDVDSLNAHATQRAFALSASLPLRVQQVVRAYHALRFGAPVAAERQFRQIVADYPTDVEAWMLLGETLFENNPLVGRSSAEAGPAFQRVMALDPRNREVTVYLMELAARAEQVGLLDTLFSMYFRPNSAGEQPGIRETYLALHARRVRGEFRAIADPVSAHIALRRAGSHPSDLQAARRYAEVLTDPTVSAALRVDGLLALASLDAANGRLESATRHWREAAALDPHASLLHEAMTMAAPRIAFPSEALRAVRAQLMTSEAELASSGLSRGEARSVRRYLTGLLSLRLGDTTGLADAQRTLAQTPASDRLAGPLGAALTGHLAKGRGDLARALTAFERSDVALPVRSRSRVPALAQHADRLAHAEVLELLQRPDEAAQWYGALRDGPFVWGAPYLVGVRD